MVKKTSKISLFNQKNYEEKCTLLQEFAELNDQDLTFLDKNYLSHPELHHLGENVISMMTLPLSLATNFIINNKDCLVPMVTEESSVVAAASHAAKLARASGGFFAEQSEALMMGQIVLVGVQVFNNVKKQIEAEESALLALANDADCYLVLLGGGARFITVEKQETVRGFMVVVQLYVDVKDAMGANIVNTMVERIAPHIEKITGAQARLKIVSNLATNRMVRVRAVWSKATLGADVIEKILDAYAFAWENVARAVTHNKGIMNGVSAVALATGNDFRALEAGAHGFAAQGGTYRPLTRYEKNEEGDLVGLLEMPLAVGIIGGVTKSHPLVPVVLKILNVSSASELACVMGAVGLAQNFAALRALITEGIQKGHMKCHSRSIAIQVRAIKEGL